jgi:uncharacterized protein YbjQ (UPF0145 family)
MAVEWQYQERGEIRKGLTSDQLRSLAGQGTISPFSPVRKVDAGSATDWVRAGDVKGLFSGDVSHLLGPQLCPICGNRLAAGKLCEACNAPPPPPPNPTFAAEIKVTTTDLHVPYEIIGPVYFQVSNKGIFSSALEAYLKKHKALLAEMRKSQQVDGLRADWGFLLGEWSVGQTDFDKAFFIGVQELKARAAMIGGNAIVGMRQDIDLDSAGWQYFYLQMYGTAVRLT